MKITEIKSCHIGPDLSPEQFIPEHIFLFLAKGSITGFDGNKGYILPAGGYCLLRKNHLARYSKEKDNGKFEKVVIVFDEQFLYSFKEKNNITLTAVPYLTGAFIGLKKDELIPNFIRSLEPYYNNSTEIDKAFSDIKREELLLILLKNNPELKNVFFDFGIPQKIDLEKFMNHNYKFNISLDRFAFLTGRSLSTFKRDFRKVFNTTPGNWLIKKRLNEAYFQINEQGKKPGSIYLELGFEDLSHFSYVFKKQFGYPPAELLKQNKERKLQIV